MGRLEDGCCSCFRTDRKRERLLVTFGIPVRLFGEVAEDGAEIWGQPAGSLSTVAAYSFLVFNLLCAPCFAAMGAIKREMNNTKWFLLQSDIRLLAYVVSCASIRSVTCSSAAVLNRNGSCCSAHHRICISAGKTLPKSATLSVSTNKMFSK